MVKSVGSDQLKHKEIIPFSLIYIMKSLLRWEIVAVKIYLEYRSPFFFDIGMYVIFGLLRT